MAELAWERSGTRAEAAALLRRVADGLESGEVELEQDGARFAIAVLDMMLGTYGFAETTRWLRGQLAHLERHGEEWERAVRPS